LKIAEDENFMLPPDQNLLARPSHMDSLILPLWQREFYAFRHILMGRKIISLLQEN
jgi:hypothetical protein